MLEEYFSGYIEEITDTDLQLRITSSEGQEATAFLPINKIPESERLKIHILAPIRVDILKQNGVRSYRIQIFDL